MGRIAHDVYRDHLVSEDALVDRLRAYPRADILSRVTAGAGFQPWHDTLPQQDRDLWKTMNKFRVDEVRRTGAEVTPTTAFIPLTEVRPGEFVPVTVDWQWLTAMQQGRPTEG